MKYIKLHTYKNNQLFLLNVNEIKYIFKKSAKFDDAGEVNAVCVFLKDGKQQFVHETVDVIFDMLKDLQFIKIHAYGKNAAFILNIDELVWASKQHGEWLGEKVNATKLKLRDNNGPYVYESVDKIYEMINK